MHLEVHHDKTISVKSSFHGHIQNTVDSLFHQYIKNIAEDELSAKVSFANGHKQMSCHIVISGGHNIMLRADAQGNGIIQAFEIATTKLIHSLKKYQNKLHNYHKNKTHNEKKVIFKKSIASIDFDDFNEYEIDNVDIVSESESNAETLTRSEAIMKLELGNYGGLPYIDKETGNLCFIHLKSDGTVAFTDMGKTII